MILKNVFQQLLSMYLAIPTLRNQSLCLMSQEPYLILTMLPQARSGRSGRREVEKLDAIDGRSRAGAQRSRIAPATEQGQREGSQQKRPLGAGFCSLPQR